MKRNFLILNLIIIFSVNCIAQPVWVGTSNPNVLAPYSPTTTKVGIGTSTPYNQNWSQLTIQNLSSGAGLNLINSSQNWEIQNVGSGAYNGCLVLFNRTNLNYGLSITSSGNVGIGINNAVATAKLEVMGNVKIRSGQLDVIGRIISSGGHIEAYNGHIQLGGDYQRWGFYTEYMNTTSKKLFISPAINSSGTWGWDYGKELILDGDGSMVKSVMTGNVKAFSVYQVYLERDVFRVMGDGKVYATEVNVSLASNFPDYVFQMNIN